ncbi:MFS transporter [Streptococcus sp. sy004]|uniref:MFS transporter n=1 Tax=Streptococcus sp. sy004 TaxID=2600149 RepID=UPI0011B70E4F|nr:MFS transporter [Streptococcus sp. sy004]TWT12124.1 MFS transporter [Streptococcus sp. sy004]
MKKILRNRLYMKILMSDLVSNFGDAVYYLALMTYITEIKNSSLAVSAINLSETLPILFTILFGFLADRTMNKVGMIIKTLWLRMLLYLAVAVAMTFQPSLVIALFASLVNFVSDILGQYENGLFYPISNQIIEEADREEVIAFRQTLTSTLAIMFQVTGVLLLTLISYASLAMLNALSFLCSLLIILSVKNQLTHASSEKNLSEIKLNTIVSDLVLDLKLSVRQLFSIKDIKSVLLTIPILNGSLAIMTSLVVINLSQTPTLILFNKATTISLLGISTVLGGILGGALVLTNNYFKGLSISTLLKINLFFVVGFFVALYLQNIVGILLMSFLSSLFVSALNPKMGALVFNNIEEDKLATIFGGMVTYFQVGDIISKALFSIIVLSLSSQQISLLYLVIVLLALIYLLFSKKSTTNDQSVN